MSEKLRKDGHEPMKKSKIFLIVAIAIVAIIAIVCLAAFSGKGDNKPDDGGQSTTGTTTGIQIPSGTTNPTESTGYPEDKPSVDADGTGITEPTKEGDPEVKDVVVDTVTDKIPDNNDDENGDKVVNGDKDKNVVETGPTSGEDRNDAILEDKENKAPVTEKEEDKPVILEDEKTTTTGGNKGDAEITDENTNVDEGNKNTPEYNPSIGGDNPFDDDTKTEINEQPVEDFIGENGYRPGEGVHF